METRSIIISVVGILLVVAIAIGLGVFYFAQNGMPQGPGGITNSLSTPSSIKVLSSKVVPSVAAYGTVSKVDGRNVTLSYEGESAVLNIGTDAKVFHFVTKATGGQASESTDFSQIKVGDNLSVNFRVLSSGQIQVFSVIILINPAASAAK